MAAANPVKGGSLQAGIAFPADRERRSPQEGMARSLRPVIREAVEASGVDQKAVAIDLDVSPNYWTRMLSLTPEQKSFDLDRLLDLPAPVFRAFAKRMAQIAGFEVVEPDARVQAIADAMGALQRVLEVVAVDLRLPERTAAQLKAKL
jgi:hypothetical protein